MHFDAIDSAVDLFASLAQLWAVVELTLMHVQPGYVPAGQWLSAWAPALVLTLVMPSKLTFGSAVAMHVAMNYSKLPYLFDSGYWSLQTDAVLLAAMLLVPRRNVVPSIEWIITAQMGMFYLAAGFWKINSSFLDPTVSCAPIFPLSLATYLPEAATPPWLLSHLATSASHVTIIGEMLIGICLLIPYRASRRLGVLLCAMLHLGIVLTPFPNQIASFSIFGLSRMFYVLAPSWAAAQAEVLVVPTTKSGGAYRAIAAVCVASSTALTTTPGLAVDWAIPVYVMLCFVCLRALIIDRRSSDWFLTFGDAFHSMPLSRARQCLNAAAAAIGRLALMLSFFYAFGVHIIGLIDIGAASPFSSIRLQGGSNHLIAPTGLLQIYAADRHAAPPAARAVGRMVEALIGAAAVADHFGGGLVRIESTSSLRMHVFSPGDVTSSLSPRLRAMLAEVGHLGRQFNPSVRRAFGHEASLSMPRWQEDGTGGPFLQYTMPALELRRVLADIRQHNESFSLTYVRLPGALGDNHWRASASGPRVSLVEDGQGGRQCAVSTGARFVSAFASSSPCASDEIAMLPPPSGLVAKLSLFFPLPVLAGIDELPCMD